MSSRCQGFAILCLEKLLLFERQLWRLTLGISCGRRGDDESKVFCTGQARGRGMRSREGRGDPPWGPSSIEDACKFHCLSWERR